MKWVKKVPEQFEVVKSIGQITNAKPDKRRNADNSKISKTAIWIRFATEPQFCLNASQ